MCGYCFKNEVELPNPFNDEDFEGLINDVWDGNVTKYTLPSSYYFKTIDNLNKGVYSGYGKDLVEVTFGSPDYEMLKDLTENIQRFSGAKTYQQVRSLTDILKTQKGKSSFSAFEKKAIEFLNEYNRNYLKAEYNTAIGSSRMAGKWKQFEEESDVLPYLQYRTVGDSRVRPEHAALDNIIRRVNDNFWSTYYPPNGWNCRCDVRQLEKGVETDLRTRPKKDENVPNEFKMNSGKDRLIFREQGKDKHPYFKIARGDKEFARTNFGLPIDARE